MKPDNSSGLTGLLLTLLIVLSFLIFFSGRFANPRNELAKKISVLVITGGHEFDPQFFNIFSSYPDITFDTITQPRANEFLCSETVKKYDALVFYDMWQDITENQKSCYMKLMKSGKGIVFLHHSLVSYENWDEFHRALGGTYYLENNKFNKKPSDYMHDLDIQVRVADTHHFITSGVKNFVIHDEGYKDFNVEPGVHILLTADNPHCDKNIAWTNHYLNSDIVYLMLGHDVKAYTNENYRKLVHNAILWVSHNTGK